MPPRGRQRLERKREAVGTSTRRFTSIFETARRDLVEDVLRAFGAAGRKENTYTGAAAPSVQRLRAVQLTRLDETIRTALPKVYRAIESGCDATYRDAVAEARINLELAGGIEQVLADSRLHLPTIELQRRVLENQATEAFLKTRLMGQRVINSYHASPPLREGIQEAITYAQVRGGGMKAAADEIFKRFNAATDWQGKDIANAVAGKFIQIGGRNYDLARYSELVAQSRFSELYNRGQVNSYVEDEYLLVQVDDHNTTAEVCMPFEATIWSITGEQIGAYKPLSQCLNGGPPFHPRCSHYLDPVEVDAVYQRKGTEVVRTSGALYDIKAYKPNEAVEAAEERIRSRIGTTPSYRAQIGWMPPDQLLKRVSAVTPDDAGAPGTVADTAPDSGEHAGNVSPGQQLTPENVEKLIGIKSGLVYKEKESTNSKTSARASAAMAQPALHSKDLFSKDEPIISALKKAEKWYIEQSDKPAIGKAFSGRPVKFDELGWKHTSERLSNTDAVKRLGRLQKAREAIELISVVHERRKLDNGDTNYGIVARCADRDAIQVVVKERNGTLHFYGVYPDKQIRKKISRM